MSNDLLRIVFSFSFAKARKFDDDYENAIITKNPDDALLISEEIFEELMKLENT